jgi:hypothetical protein
VECNGRISSAVGGATGSSARSDDDAMRDIRHPSMRRPSRVKAVVTADRLPPPCALLPFALLIDDLSGACWGSSQLPLLSERRPFAVEDDVAVG